MSPNAADSRHHGPVVKICKSVLKSLRPDEDLPADEATEETLLKLLEDSAFMVEELEYVKPDVEKTVDILSTRRDERLAKAQEQVRIMPVVCALWLSRVALASLALPALVRALTC